MAQHAAHRRPWWQRPWRWVPLLALLVAGLVLGSVIIVITQGPPLVAGATSSVATLRRVAGMPAAPTWPSVGQGAVAVTGVTSAMASPNETPVPIGSIAKVMTAIVVLTEHPLSTTDTGPTITISATDVAEWRAELTTDQSNVPIATGETLTERQLLEGLLIHSGNDYAHLLARMDGRDEATFVADMNAQAQAWGLTETHYVDPSGFDPATTSTARDQVVVGRHALRYPVIAAVVSKQATLLPVAGVETSYTPLVGTNGVVGIKSGLTTEAGGCDLLALATTVDGQPVQVISAVLGQRGPDRLALSGQRAYDLAVRQTGQFARVTVSTPHGSVGTFGWSGHHTLLRVAAASIVPAWPGSVVVAHLELRHGITSTVLAGSRVGDLVVRAGPVTVRTPVVTSTTVHPPSLLERLT